MPTGYTTVSASYLQDATGTPITNATISFQPVDNKGNPLSFRAGGTSGQVISQPVTATVTAGAFSLSLADTTLTTPANVGYAVTVKDNITGKSLLGNGYGCVQPSGSTWSLDSYVPNVAHQAIIQYGPSAYDLAVQNGFSGSVSAWLATLVGPTGASGITSPNFTAEIIAPVGIKTPEVDLNGYTVVGFPTEEGYLEIVADALGNIITGVNSDLSPVYAPSTTGISTMPQTEDGAALVLLDSSNNEILAFDFSGNRILNPLQIPQVTTFFSQPGNWAPFDPAAFTAILNHLTLTGQSLSVGANSFPILSTSAPYTYNKRLGASVNAYTLGQTGVSLQNLSEVQATGGSGTDGGETCGTSTGANIASLVAAHTLSHPALFSGSGISGLPYSMLCGPTDWVGATYAGVTYPQLTGGVNLGSPSFREMMSQITLGHSLAGGTYAHRAVILVHGETDANISNTNYHTNLLTWQQEIQSASNAITGGTANIPFLMTQCVYSITGLQQLQVAMSNPMTHTLVCPEYQIPHQGAAELAAGANALHLSAAGQRIHGAYIAKAYTQRILRGLPWVPLVPKQVSIIGKTIVIDYLVPVTPIVLDTSLVTDPGNSGFAYADALGTQISSVAVTGEAQITITLNQFPSTASQGTRTLTYGLIGNPASSGQLGPLYGPRGCVRDSDPALSYYTEVNPVSDDVTGSPAHIHLYNYSVCFSTTI